MLDLKTKKVELSAWDHHRKKRKKKILVALAAVFLAAAISLIIKNNTENASMEKTLLASKEINREPVVKTTPVEVWDGKNFKKADQDKIEDIETNPQSQENLYSYRLLGCVAHPQDEKQLSLLMVLDLNCRSKELMAEIKEKETDLRTLVNLLISSKKLDEIDIPSLRPEIIERLNQMVRKGKIVDVRFVDFRIERQKPKG